VTEAVSSTLTLAGTPTVINGGYIDIVASTPGSCSGAASTYVISGSSTAAVTIPAAATGYVICFTAGGGNDASQLQSFGTLAAVAATTVHYTDIGPATAVTSVNTPFTLTGTKISTETVILATSCSGATPNIALTGTTNPTFAQSIGSAGTYKVCLRAAGGSDSVEQTGLTVVLAAAVAGDPVAYNGDRKLHFWLPIGVLMPLLRTPDLDIFGSTYPGLNGKKGQFFERYLVVSRGGLTVDVALRNEKVLNMKAGDTVPGVLPFNDTRLLPTDSLNNFSVLSVNYVEGHMRGTVGIDDGITQVQGLTGESRADSTKEHLPTEAVEFFCSSVHFTVCNSYAVDMSYDEEKLLLDFAHLAIQMVRFEGAKDFGGVFPELWGIRNQSKCTEMLTDMEGEPVELPQECYDWDGYGGVKGLEEAKKPMLEL
jgi:hypothetical protein